MTLKTIASQDLVCKFIDKMDILSNIKNVCRKIITELETLNIVKRYTSKSTAAGVLLFVCQEMSIVADETKMIEMCGVSTLTSSTIAKKICQHKKEIFCAINNKK